MEWKLRDRITLTTTITITTTITTTIILLPLVVLYVSPLDACHSESRSN